ncbi:unnamed protein product, partial [Symbiodinium necroappetens]
EAGHAATAAEYVASFASYQPISGWRFSVEAVPTLGQVERIVHSLQRGKAAGCDGITGELLRASAVQTARHLLPVLAKTALRAREPVTFRGGDLILLAKRAASVLTCESYRSILISSVPAKVYHRCLREQLQPAFADHRTTFQGGVLPGQGIEFVALTAKTFFRLCNTANRRAAIIFFDLRAAFYQVLRQLLTQNQESDQALLQLFSQLRLPNEAVQELRHHLSKAAELERAGASEHTRALIADMFRGSWFRLSGHSMLTITKRGTRPGDPTADILFAFTLTAFVRHVTTVLAEAHLQADIPQSSARHHSIPYEGTVDLGCPSWADDFFFPQTAGTDEELIQRVRRSATLLASHATSLGMTVKYGTDKTSVLLPATVPVTSPLLDVNSKGQSGLAFEDSVSREVVFLPVVAAYRHLGGIVTANGDPLPDLHLRFSNAMGVIRPLRKKLFGTRRFDVNVRKTLLQSLAVSRYVHTASALILNTAQQVRVWEKQYLHLWRSLTARTAADVQAHNYEVLRVGQASAPPLALAQARAALLAKLYTNGPAALLALLFDHWELHPRTAWMSQFRQDWQCVLQYVPSVKDCISEQDTIPDLLSSYAEDVRKHLHAHLAKSHAVFSPARHYAIGPRCEVCMRHYGKISQVQQHLKQSTACLLRCLYLFRPLSVCEIREIEGPEKKRRQAVLAGKWEQFACSGPPRRAPIEFGPRLPTAEERAYDPDPTEDAVVSALVRPFLPSDEDVRWITAHVA